MKQKGIISYGIAPNRQYPLAGAVHDAFFNTWRRFSMQVLYWAPPMVAGYYVLNWAIERYVTFVDRTLDHI
jgi:ubiquinol-cytochrome c reductase subunit 8